jgi:hypothetical protein
MIIVRSQNGAPIRLTDERWRHITRGHPELFDQGERILETVTEPDFIQEGDFDELLAIRFYRQTPLTSKYCVVAYREIGQTDGFILTAYLTRRPSAQRTTIWTR